MRQLLTKWFGKSTEATLADILANARNKEDFLGVSSPVIPTPDKIRQDASRLISYSKSQEYSVFATEVWARMLSSLDTILDDKTSDDKVKYHRGYVKACLDLLRLSHQAKSVRDQLEKDQKASNAPLPR